MGLTSDPLRLLAAASLVLAYGCLCLVLTAAELRKRRAAAALVPAAGDSPAWLVAYASQTGTAADFAWQTANTLHLAGVSARLCSLGELDAATLRQAERLLLVVSTCGEGDAPDNGAVFARDLLGTELPLQHLHYGVLALGDRDYTHFCAFGRALASWLKQQGAQALFDPIEADRCDPGAISAWRQQLAHLAGTSDAPDWNAPAFADWRLVERRCLNPGSSGGPVYHLALEPADGSSLPDWQAGDLVQVAAPGAPDRPRDYSIASIPADGRLHLLVRQHRRADGTLGTASGWLTAEAGLQQSIQMRLRPHRLFRLEENAGKPLILIGNGTGLAGLRAHLKARAQADSGPNWLIYGERQAAHDFHHREDIQDWQASGVLARLDLAFSRDAACGRYVQDRLREAANTLRAWVEEDAAIYVCGSLEGMAAGVDQALADILGRDRLEALAVAGRYRRDVY